jgi:hypothetical protein
VFYNDWLTYDLATAWSQQGGKFGEYRGLTDMWINHYPYEDYKPTTYQDALIRQCKAIAENFKPAIFVSGGVDSHAAALGFKWADVGADFVHVRNSFNGHTCEVEWEFTKAFAKKHDIDLKVIDMEYTQDSLTDFMLECEYFENGQGSGCIFTLAGMLKYMEQYDGYPVGTDGLFKFENEGNIRRGVFKKPGVVFTTGHHVAAHTGYQYNNWGSPVILMLYYAPYLLQYFEYKHRTTPELKILNKVAAKTLVYHELGLQLRPKLSNYEFLDLENDYRSLAVVDLSNDHSQYARYERGPNVIVKAMGFTGDKAKELISQKLEYQEGIAEARLRRFVLYEFEDLETDKYLKI